MRVFWQEKQDVGVKIHCGDVQKGKFTKLDWAWKKDDDVVWTEKSIDVVHTLRENIWHYGDNNDGVTARGRLFKATHHFWPHCYDPHRIISVNQSECFSYMHIIINQPTRCHHYYPHSVISYTPFSKHVKYYILMMHVVSFMSEWRMNYKFINHIIKPCPHIIS